VTREIRCSDLAASREDAYQEYVRRHSDATVYHLLQWRGILAGEYRFEPHYRIAERGADVCGVLPLFLVRNLRRRAIESLPFSIYGGPLADDVACLEALLRSAVDLSAKGTARRVTIKVAGNDGDAFLDCGFQAVGGAIRTTVALDRDPEAHWEALPGKTRRAIRRAQKNDVVVRPFRGVEDIEPMVELQLRTRRRHGMPTPSLRYYQNLWNQLAPEGLAHGFLATVKDRPAAAALFFTLQSRMLYVLGVSAEESFACSPNDAVMWEAIRWGYARQHRLLDFGLSPRGNAGLLAFKKKWVSEENPQPHYEYPEGASRSGAGGALEALMSGTLKSLPIGLAKHLGPRLIRWFG